MNYCHITPRQAEPCKGRSMGWEIEIGIDARGEDPGDRSSRPREEPDRSALVVEGVEGVKVYYVAGNN